jgi:hypothetical protein
VAEKAARPRAINPSYNSWLVTACKGSNTLHNRLDMKVYVTCDERERISLQTVESLLRKAELGFVPSERKATLLSPPMQSSCELN